MVIFFNPRSTSPASTIVDGLAGTEVMRRRWDDPPIGVVIGAQKDG